MRRVDRIFFLVRVWTWNRCWPSWQKMRRDRDCWFQLIEGNEGLAGLFLHLFTSFSLFSHDFPLFPSFSSFSSFFFFPFFCTFSHLFHLFSHYFPLFHIISLFFHRFSLFFSHSFSHFRWPGRGRSLAALPCLPLPYLTLPLLSSPSLTLFKKRSIEIFSRFPCWEEVLAQADFKVYPYV